MENVTLFYEIDTMWRKGFRSRLLRLLRKLYVSVNNNNNNYRNRKCSWQTRTGSAASCTLSCPSVAIVPNLCPDHVHCPRAQTHTRKDNARLHQSNDWDVHVHAKTFIINWDIHCRKFRSLLKKLMSNWKILIGTCMQDYTFGVAIGVPRKCEMRFSAFAYTAHSKLKR